MWPLDEYFYCVLLSVTLYYLCVEKPQGLERVAETGLFNWCSLFLFHHLHNYQRFAAVIMRIRDPKTTALIFASGKMVVTGAKSEDDSKLASRKYARIIQKLGFAAKFTDFKIQNIVGSCDVKFPIRLEGLAYAHGPFTSVRMQTPSLNWLEDKNCLANCNPVHFVVRT